MSNGVFGWNNLIDPDLNSSASLSGGGTVSNLPVQNLQDEQPQKFYRTIGTSAYFIADLGSSKSVECAAVMMTNMSVAGAARVRASVTDPAATSSLVYDSNTDSTKIYSGPDPRWNGNVLVIPTAAFSARYIRVDVSDASPVVPTGSSAYINIGHTFIGPLFRPTFNFSYGAQAGYADLSAKSNTPGGQVMTKKNPKARTRRISFDILTEAEVYAQVLEMDRIIGESKGYLLVGNPAGTYLAQDWWWGTTQNMQNVNQPSFGIFSRAWDFTERL